jgi:hypothetical protein
MLEAKVNAADAAVNAAEAAVNAAGFCCVGPIEEMTTSTSRGGGS